MRDGLRAREAGRVWRGDIVAMLAKLGRRGYAVHENQALYTVGIDPDTDSDPEWVTPNLAAEADGKREQTDRQPPPRGDA